MIGSLKKYPEIPLFPIIDLESLCGSNHLRNAELADFAVGWNRNVYLLLMQSCRQQSVDRIRTPSVYTVIEIKVDWRERQVRQITLFPVGTLEYQFDFLRPAGDSFLLLGARSNYGDGKPDSNAWMINRDGEVLSRFCLGDGIQNCAVKQDGTIITGYFDEGVFGNYGWEEPLGACGLIAWSPSGAPVWRNERYPIHDCYAINLDDEENLWFYYYDEFKLIRTDFKADLVFDMPLKGSSAFSVSSSGETFLFQGGYEKVNRFYRFIRQGQHLVEKGEVTLVSGGKKIKAEQYSMQGSRMLFLGKDGCFYGGVLEKSDV